MVKKINVLSVGSTGKRNQISPFRLEQAESLRRKGINVSFFNIKGKGIIGYMKDLPLLKKKIKTNNYNIIHAHYGLSGMLSVMQRRLPVVITFHGSDIWRKGVRKISLIASYLSSWNIYISKALQDRAKGFRKRRTSIVPCGVDLKKFFPIDKANARETLGMKSKDKYILFSSSFTKKIKNYPLAKMAMEYIPGVNLIELEGYKKEEVNCLMNACDVLLVTSFDESGPLVVKEAMACNLPIVSTNVGDVQEVIGNTEGCFLISYDPKDVVEKIKMALDFNRRTDGRQYVKKYEIDISAERIKDIFYKILKK
jgi:glycosyltransferase involved in cell wall biosynthesis